MNRLSLILTYSWIGYEQILLCSKMEMAIARWTDEGRRLAGWFTVDGKEERREGKREEVRGKIEEKREEKREIRRERKEEKREE